MENQNKKTEKAWWQPAVEVFAQISGWIVFPLLLAIYVGNWLEGKYGHEPWLYVGSVAVAFVITNIGLVKIAVKASKKIQQSAEEIKEKEK